MPCIACGRENPPEARFCQTCGAKLTASAPPRRPVSPSPVARLGDRLLAVILDTLLLAVTFAVVGMWAAGRWGGVTAGGFEMTGTPALVTVGVVLVVGFLYYWVFEGLFGATLGKAMVGIAVSAGDDGRCGAKRSLIRNLLRAVDALGVYLVGFLIAVFSKRRQRLGDHVAGTVVVERDVGRPWRLALVVVWVAAIGAGIWGALVLHRAAPTEVVGVPPETAGGGGVPTTATPTPEPSIPPILTSGDLKLTSFGFLTSSEGPRRPSGPFKPGERLFLTFEVTGLTTDPEGRFHVTYGAEAFDPNGVLLQKFSQDLNGTPGSANTATISGWFDIPRYVPPGAARIRATAHDQVKNTDGELVAPWAIDAPVPAISTQLEIRNLRFSRSEDGPALDPAVISSGETLYVAGELAGVQFRGDDVDVGIAFEVFGPDGSKVIDKPDFLVVRDSFVYHPPSFCVPLTAHLRLPSDAAKGAYRERYVVSDRFAGMSRTHELAFTLQ